MTSTVIKPTVGRKVWYRPFGHHRTQLGVWNDEQPCDATVTYVWGDRMVNLHVIGPAGAVHQFNSVTLLQAGDIAPNLKHGGYAEWMPYQQGQVRKDAAIDRVVAMNTPLGSFAAPSESIALPFIDPGHDSLEREIQAKGLTAPRVTPADLQANIVHTEIVKYVSPSGQVLRWAVLTTRNGFAVTGRPSASVSSANDNAEIGERVAIDNAKQELWPLMGYALRDELAHPVLTDADAAADLAGTPRPSLEGVSK